MSIGDGNPKPDEWPEDLFKGDLSRSREDLERTRDRVSDEIHRVYMA